jgi:hypothetical protein
MQLEYLRERARKAAHLLACCCFALAIFGARAAGGETAAAGERATVKQPFWEWERGDRRDPMEFMPPSSERDQERRPPPGGGLVSLGGPGEGPGIAPVLPQTGAEVERQRAARAEARQRGLQAEFHLSQQQFSRVEEVTAGALQRLKDANVQDPPLFERLERLRETGSRLKDRREKEAEFSRLRIDIQGIIWEPGNPVALINGQTVKPGQAVEGALVEDIRPGEVVFLYKDVHVRKSP